MIKMFFLLHQSSRISHIIFFAIISFVSQTCLSQENPYIQCAPRNHTCGNTTFTIRFPFSFFGQPRPSYCSYTNYTLHCRQGNLIADPLLPGFHIKRIDYDTHILHIVDGNFTSNDVPCPRPYANSTIRDHPLLYVNDSNSNQNVVVNILAFNYTQQVQNLTLYTSCSSPPTVEINNVASRMKKLDCLSSNTTSAAYVARDEGGMATVGVEGRCSGPVRVLSVMRTAAEDLFQNRRGFGEVLRTGFEVEWLWGSKWCKRCESSQGLCGFNETEPMEPICFCPCGTTLSACSCGNSNKTLKIVIGVGAALGCCLLTCSMAYVWYGNKRRNFYSSETMASSISSKSDCSHLPTHIFSYKELQEATNNFSASNEVGEGGFGAVYLGKLYDGRSVAVKRLYESNYRRLEQFMNEIEILSRLRHPNLVSLYGSTSQHSRELLLVYDYIPNGTVADHLYGNRAGGLMWSCRMNIAIETADALAYLHAIDIIHRDVKANNILLDKNFQVKVGDFGLSRLFPVDKTHVSTAPQGTPGYVDPDYHYSYQLNDKSDVYSFAVVLFELISSKPAVDIMRPRNEVNLSNMAITKMRDNALHELVDPNLGFESDSTVQRQITMVAELAYRCLHDEKEMRPAMEEVLKLLKEIESDKRSVEKAGDIDTGEDCEKENPTLSPDSVTALWISKSSTPNTSR